MKQKYTYGDSVIEFFPHSEQELQALVEKAEALYQNTIESRLHNRLGANIAFLAEPLAVALNELHKKQLDGFTIVPERYVGIRGATLDVSMRKPADQIEQDLIVIRAQVAEEYEASRYQKNLDEQQRQLDISISLIAKKAEQARVAAEQAAADEIRTKALKELKEAYAA